MTLPGRRASDDEQLDRCECIGDHGLYRWRGDASWWSCAGCDMRVRMITAAELIEHEGRER